jgi:hypothetical protein
VSLNNYYNYYVIRHQFDPSEEVFQPYAMSIVKSNKCKGYGTLEEAKKVLEKVQHNYEIETKAENEYEEKLALAKGEEYNGQSYAMQYSIYRMQFSLRLKK